MGHQRKISNVSVSELLGGSLREKVELYWSHCGTSRVRASELIKNQKFKPLMI